MPLSRSTRIISSIFFKEPDLVCIRIICTADNSVMPERMAIAMCLTNSTLSPRETRRKAFLKGFFIPLEADRGRGIPQKFNSIHCQYNFAVIKYLSHERPRLPAGRQGL